MRKIKTKTFTITLWEWSSWITFPGSTGGIYHFYHCQKDGSKTFWSLDKLVRKDYSGDNI